MGWFIFLAVSDCLLMSAMDTVIMLRGGHALICLLRQVLNDLLYLSVYALYNRSTKVALLLVSLLITQMTLVTVCTSRTLPKVPFNGNCDLKTPHNVVYFM
jgi:hypothetical protein